MPEQLQSSSPLASLRFPDGGETLRLEEGPGLGKLVLRGDARDDNFRSAVERAVGLAPPPPGHTVKDGPITLLWQGPDSWLIVASPDRISLAASKLKTALAGMHAAITDVSSATTVLRIAGSRARDLLYKGCFLDLDPPAFTVGQCAATRIAAFAVTIHQLDDEPAYDLYVARSMALAFGEWILDAGLEYGLGQTTI